MIPTEHDVYGTGECGVMALKHLSLTTPDDGQVKLTNGMNFGGGKKIHPDLPSYQILPCYGKWDLLEPANKIIETCKYGYFPYECDNVISGTKVLNPKDPTTKYNANVKHGNSDGGYLPCVYLENNKRNPDYGDTSTTPMNPFSDFDGKSNTEILQTYATGQPDWKTASEIENVNDETHYPIVCSCWRYHTPGTKHGDWYIPALGELGYLGSRTITIWRTIQKIREWNKIYECTSDYLSHCFTSSTSSIEYPIPGYKDYYNPYIWVLFCELTGEASTTSRAGGSYPIQFMRGVFERI